MTRENQPVPNAPFEIQEQVVRYLLDEMDDAERGRLEERLISTPEFSDTIASIEDDLIMEYVRGDLEPRLASRFNEVYMNSPGKRARVEEAMALRRAVREVAAERKTRPQAARSLRIPLGIAAVAAVIVLAAVLWPLRHRAPGGSVTEPPKLAYASFSLEPGVTRSGGGAEITLPAGIDEVHFDLAVPDASGVEGYQVVLATAERPVAWKGVAAPKDGRLVAVVPAKVLSAGDYMLELQSNGQEVMTFHFRVAK
jgi:hypothetical protein